MKQSVNEVLKNLQNWRPPGPVAQGWFESRAPMHFLMGPVGGGKTWTGAMKCLDIARQQHPSTIDGVRKAKVIAVRMNYRHAHKTLMESFFKLFPQEMAQANVGWDLRYVQDGPVDYDIRINDDQHGKILLQFRLRTFGDQDVIAFTKGNETTSWWLNETDEMPAYSLGSFYERVGRAFLDERPDPEVVPPAWSGVFGDFNAPDEDSWLNDDLFVRGRDDCEVFIQPSGFSPNAENIVNLRKIRKNYYQTMASKLEDWQVTRQIENKVGPSRAGKPVFTQFNRSFHVATQPLAPVPGQPIRIGIDPGLDGAALIGQENGRGLLQCFREAVTPNGEAWDAEIMANEIFEILTGNGGMFEPFLNRDLLRFAPDPGYANQKTGILKDVTWLINFEAAMKELLGLCPIYLPATNWIDPRLKAVRHFLKSPDGHPRFLLDREGCPETRKALGGGYRFERVKGDNGEWKVQPEKNHASNPADACQYLCLDAGNGPSGTAHKSAKERRVPPRPRQTRDLAGAAL